MKRIFFLVELDSGKTFEWGIEELLNEINRDRSDGWTPYNERDWEDGWFNWCEGDFYSLMVVEYEREV